MNKRASAGSYQRLSPKAVKELIAPQTWAASIFAVLVGVALTYALAGVYNIVTTLLLLLVAILMQGAVNTLNDYFDFVKGTDTADNCVDTSDASIIYNHIDPKSALGTAIVLLALAAALGLILIFRSGWLLLAVGAVGGLIILAYSAGPLPLSYTPLGEAASGFTMGGLIPFACYYALTGVSDPWVIYYAAPVILTIALIMLTNNTCDIDRDVLARRKTLPVLLGKKVASFLLGFGYIITIMTIAHLGFWEFRWGVLAVIPLVLLGYRPIKTLFTLDLNHKTRITAMQTTLKLTCSANLCYILAIMIGAWTK